MSDAPRVLVVMPGLPEQRSGGGLMLYELLAWLVDRAGRRGQVAVVVPVPESRRGELAALEADPVLRGVHWDPLQPHRAPGLWGRLRRACGPLPADMAKVATATNEALLEAARARLRPTVELAVSSWALAAYESRAFAPGTRLFMVNVDPDVVRHEGAWFAGGRLDADALLRKIACAIDRPKVRRICRRALATAARVGAVSPADVAPLDRLGSRRDTVYLPPLMRPRPLDRSAAEPGTVLLTSNFTYSPNVTGLAWLLREVWPHVAAHARLTVVGHDPRGAGARLCASCDRARYTGLLAPADLDKAFARTAVAVNPTRSGSGFQVKLLDAIARGVPIVSTAWSNKLGPAIPASDDPREFARLVNERLTPASAPPFDYAAFHAQAAAAWETFLFSSQREEP